MTPRRESASHGSPVTPQDRPRPCAHVAFVGAGPGDPGLITTRGLDYLRRACKVLIDPVIPLEFARRLSPAEALHVDEVDLAEADAEELELRAGRLVEAVRELECGEDRLIVRLMDGDPSTFNGLAAEAAACRKAGIPFEVVPGVSAVSAIPAYTGVALTDPEHSVHLVHGPDQHVDWAACVDERVNVVILGNQASIGEALTSLSEAGRDRSTPVALTEHGTMTNQVTHVTTLGAAPALVGDIKNAGVRVAIVGAGVGHRSELSWFETKPLFGWQVLVPRTREQAGDMQERLESYGATPTVVPTISVEPPRTPQQMERAIKGLVTGRFEWIGFTSANAVRAVREKFNEYGLDARAFAGLRIAAVGGVTADALREWGIEPDLVPSGEQSARGLLEDWPEYDSLTDPINRVLLPRADIATDVLVSGLSELGWEVEDVTAYRTVRAAPPPAEIRESIKTGRFDAVLFTSSSTVRNLIGIAGKPHHATVVACIGQATARTAEEHGLKVDVIAPEASALSLVDSLAEHGFALGVASAEAGEPALRPSLRRGRRRRARI